MLHHKCYGPWGNFIVSLHGDVFPCCVLGEPTGNLHEDSLESIWNSKEYMNLRNSGCEKCYLCETDGLPVHPHSYHNIDKDSVFGRNLLLNIDEYNKDKLYLKSKPTFYSLTMSYQCNLNCIMCWQGIQWIPFNKENKETPNLTLISHERDKTELSEKIVSEVKEYLAYADTISLVGGETFIIPSILKFLREFSSVEYPNVKFLTATNLTILNDDIISLLNKFSCVTLHISIDGATKETYEKIRRGSNWEQVIKNLTRVSHEKKFEIIIQYCVMRSNFFEIGKAVKLAGDSRVKITFNPVSGIHLINENIFEHPNLLYGLNWNVILDEAIEISKKYNHIEGFTNNVEKRLNYIRRLLKCQQT